MSQEQTSAGTIFSVSIAQPATEDVAGYEALTWVALGTTTSLGEIGPEYQVTTYDIHGNRVTQKLKGQVNMGSQAVELVRVLNNPAQIIMKNAVTIDSATEDSIHSFKLEYKDGDIQYYQGLPISYRSSIGGPDDMISAAAAIELTSKIIEDLAA